MMNGYRFITLVNKNFVPKIYEPIWGIQGLLNPNIALVLPYWLYFWGARESKIFHCQGA